MGSDSKLEEPSIDPFLDTDGISGLTNKTFNDFIQHKDATLVMFYYLGPNSSPTTEEKWCKKQFVKAAVMSANYETDHDFYFSSTLRKSSAYAAVNCANESLICKMQDVDTYPTYKLYTKGIPVGTLRDKHSADFKLLKSYVDLCPVVGENRRPEPKCKKISRN